VRGADVLSVLGQPQRDALVMLFLRLHDQGLTINEIFWGLWLIPLAILVYRSRFVPRPLGVWLFINGVAYVILSLIGLLAPQYEDTAFKMSAPARFGEMVFMLWLLIMGAKDPPGWSPGPWPVRPGDPT
jgi:hypothetical protein